MHIAWLQQQREVSQKLSVLDIYHLKILYPVLKALCDNFENQYILNLDWKKITKYYNTHLANRSYLQNYGNVIVPIHICTWVRAQPEMSLLILYHNCIYFPSGYFFIVKYDFPFFKCKIWQGILDMSPNIWKNHLVSWVLSSPMGEVWRGHS